MVFNEVVFDEEINIHSEFGLFLRLFMQILIFVKTFFQILSNFRESFLQANSETEEPTAIFYTKKGTFCL